jgi:UDP-N-acetylglucosamine--N-acetylmuramyl-(pentapeptide) pyrophosphoryl-undecaprenol N-acetylglucosamine transferase
VIRRVLVAGGGTGGHLFPGLAVVEELRRRDPVVDVLFVGTERGLEARLLPKLGERFHAIDVAPLVRVGAWRTAQALAALPRAGVQAIGVLLSFRPDLVLGLGGYASGPVLAAAATMRVRSALLEQNVHVGLTNRLLARGVGRAYLAYEAAVPFFGQGRARVLGNPLRRAFLEAANLADHDPVGLEARARGVLVIGGSQGARALNEQVPEAVAHAAKTVRGLHVVHQTGESAVAEVRARYAALGVDAEVVPFIDDIARAYSRAAVVIARAGAGTLAELCAIGRPSILIPLPRAAEDHQTKNAVALEVAGAAVAIRESDLAVERLGGELRSLLSDAERRRAMASAARRLGRPDAAQAIVDDLHVWFGVPDTGDGGDGPGREPEGAGGDASDGATAATPGSSTPVKPARRQPKVTRAKLRLRPLDPAADGTG